MVTAQRVQYLSLLSPNRVPCTSPIQKFWPRLKSWPTSKDVEQLMEAHEAKRILWFPSEILAPEPDTDLICT